MHFPYLRERGPRCWFVFDRDFWQDALVLVMRPSCCLLILMHLIWVNQGSRMMLCVLRRRHCDCWSWTNWFIIHAKVLHSAAINHWQGMWRIIRLLTCPFFFWTFHAVTWGMILNNRSSLNLLLFWQLLIIVRHVAGDWDYRRDLSRTDTVVTCGLLLLMASAVAVRFWSFLEQLNAWWARGGRGSWGIWIRLSAAWGATRRRSGLNLFS